ncbi:MAG: hypothetical protein K2H01_10865 [Ruminococcus sp.]|nr:hypothetical protein [Ruminococcus sp.]
MANKKTKKIKGREIFPLKVGEKAYFYIEETGEIIETSYVQKVTEVDVFNYVVETEHTIYEFQRFGLLTEEIRKKVTDILANRGKSS